jgi:hypothetical protein
MKLCKLLLVLALTTAVALPSGVAFAKPAARTEIKLKYGINDVHAGKMVLRIVRAFVSNLTANSFDTYTVYLLPEKAGESWLQVTVPAPNGIGYNLRTYEAADANIEAVSFYKEGDQVYSVRAARVSKDMAELNLEKSKVVFHVSKFNQDGDVPMFGPEKISPAKARYQDASDALEQEFFSP